MKDCCKTGDEQITKKKRPWLKWMLYLIILAALSLVIFEQLKF
ncbi:hypothetical protein [Pontibacter fetidus]|nr:hypothetical protein [Pontibacter fetidus]